MFENPEVVDSALVRLFGNLKDLPTHQWLNKRNEVTRILIETDFKDQAHELDAWAKMNHKRGLEEWGLELGTIDEAEDVQSYVFPHSLSTHH